MGLSVLSIPVVYTREEAFNTINMLLEFYSRKDPSNSGFDRIKEYLDPNFAPSNLTNHQLGKLICFLDYITY